MNINRSRFPEELQEQATSLALATGQEFDRGALVLALAEQIEAAVQALEKGRVEELEECFRQRLGLYEKRVSWDGAITDDLNLIFTTPFPPASYANVAALPRYVEVEASAASTGR